MPDTLVLETKELAIFAVRDFVMSDDKTEPPFGTVFALNMLVATAHGSTYSRSEYAAWLGEACFDEPELIVVPDAGNATVLVARKPKTTAHPRAG